VILAFDTATSFGAVASAGGRSEREARAGDVLLAVDRLVGGDPSLIESIVVGRGPGSFTSIRIGLAVARSLASALRVPLSAASTLEAYGSGTPVLDARRGEVFAPGPTVCAPDALDVAGKVLLGDGAIRYREIFERRGAVVPADDDPAHVPDVALLVEHARADVEPLYVRDPDAKAQP
jgi:tRNA threonylcarbamoyladenosine biosynthesis protein TsaB